MVELTNEPLQIVNTYPRTKCALILYEVLMGAV